MDEERKETNTEDEKEEIKAPTEEEPRNKKRNKKKILKSLGRNLLLVGIGFLCVSLPVRCVLSYALAV